MKKKYNRKPRRKFVRRVRKGGRRTVPERASCKETLAMTQLLNTNQVYTSYTTQLSSFIRASLVAKAYQLYRIKNVKVILSPLSDTFVAGGGTSVPYLYYMIDRTKSLQYVDTAYKLKKLGAKPRRLDDKIISFQYRPSVLIGGLDSLPPAGQSTTQFTQYKVSPWLSTRDAENIGVWNADSTDHQGIVWIVENAGGNQVQYKCEVLVDFEFMKPAQDLTRVQGAPEPIEIDTLRIVEETPVESKVELSTVG